MASTTFPEAVVGEVGTSATPPSAQPSPMVPGAVTVGTPGPASQPFDPPLPRLARTAAELAATGMIIKSWQDLMRAVGMAPHVASSFLTALDIEEDDPWEVLTMGPLDQFWKDLEAWSWTSTSGDTIVEHRPKTKHLGQAGMVRDLAAQLAQRQRALAPGTLTAEQSPQALPHAPGPAVEETQTRAPVTPKLSQIPRGSSSMLPPADKEDDDDVDGDRFSDDGSDDAPLAKPVIDKTKIVENRPSKKPRLDHDTLRTAITTRPRISEDQKRSRATKVKIHHVLDQSIEREVELLPKKVLQEMYEFWAILTGDDAPENCEPTEEQITAMDDVVGDGQPPNADFAVFGNADYVDGRKAKLRGMNPNADGTWSPVELVGPPTFKVWTSCWDVYRTLVAMMRIITTSTTDRYSAKAKYYFDLYGPGCLHIMLQADTKARGRFWDRARRKAVRLHRCGRLPDFSEENPWEVALRLLIEDHAFWNERVNLPCILVSAKTSAQTQIVREVAGPTRA